MEEIHHKKGKIYYSMGEVAEMFDVNPSLIRFWEQKFDILKPHKNKKGNRMFTTEDVDNLKLIYHLVKEKGMTLAGAQKRIKENRTGAKRDMEVVDRLLNIRSMLMEIRQELKMDETPFITSHADEPLIEELLEKDLVECSDDEEAVIEAIAELPPEEPETTVSAEEVEHMEEQARKETELAHSDTEAEWVDEELERVDDVADMIEGSSTAPYPETTMEEVMQMEAAAAREIEYDKQVQQADGEWVEEQLENISGEEKKVGGRPDDLSIADRNASPGEAPDPEDTGRPAHELQRLFDVEPINDLPVTEREPNTETEKERSTGPIIMEQTLF